MNQKMPRDDEPIAMYFGHSMEAVFLKSLLEGSGIPAWLSDFSIGGSPDVRVYVAKSDVERALPIVDHFRDHGKKTPP